MKNESARLATSDFKLWALDFGLWTRSTKPDSGRKPEHEHDVKGGSDEQAVGERDVREQPEAQAELQGVLFVERLLAAHQFDELSQHGFLIGIQEAL